MATETTNYKLKKPDLTDFVEVTVLNQNFDTIDAELKKVNDTATTGGAQVQQKLTTLETAIGTVGNLQTKEKTNLVGALNELFLDSGNGKTLIADAITGIDSSKQVTGNSTFQQLADAIKTISTKKSPFVPPNVVKDGKKVAFRYGNGDYLAVDSDTQNKNAYIYNSQGVLQSNIGDTAGMYYLVGFNYLGTEFYWVSSLNNSELIIRDKEDRELGTMSLTNIIKDRNIGNVTNNDDVIFVKTNGWSLYDKDTKAFINDYTYDHSGNHVFFPVPEGLVAVGASVTILSNDGKSGVDTEYATHIKTSLFGMGM